MVAAYADPLATGRSFTGRDLIPYNLPLEKSVHDAWARGRLPVWFPDASGGRPLMPNPNSGVLYPVRPLLSLLPFPVAMRISPVLHWAAAAIGVLWLMEAIGVSAAASGLAAVTYAFSGVIVSELYYSNFLPGATLLPWLLWSLVRPARTAGRRVIVTAVVFGLLFLAGDVFTSGLALLAALLWVGLEVGHGDRRREAGLLALGAVLGAMLAAPQIFATALLVPETHRAVIGMKLAETLHFSVSPWRLLELAVPYPFGAVWSQELPIMWAEPPMRFFFATLYAGAFSLAALAAVWRRPAEKGARFTRALAAVSILVAVVPSFAPRAMLEWASPIPLRYPEKFCVALALALALASGLALDRFRRAPAPRGILAIAAGLAAAALAADLWPAPAGRLAAAAVGALPSAAAVASRSLPGALAEGGLYWAAAFLALGLWRRGRAARAAGLAMLVLTPIAADRRIARTDSEAAVFAPTPFARSLARRDPEGRYRTLDESPYRPPSAVEIAAQAMDPGGSDFMRRAWSLHTPALWGRGTVFNSDLDVGDLSRVDSLRRASSALAALPNAGVFFGSVALRYGIRWRDLDAIPGYRPYGRDGLQIWDENPEASPDVRLLSRWRESAGAVEALRAIPALSAGEVVLETGRGASGEARPGVVRILERSPERLRLDVSSPDPAWLFVLRGFWSHRTVKLDAREVETVPAQIAFTAVPVPAGIHRIDWQEEAPGGRYSVLGPLGFALAAWLLGRPRSAEARA